MNRKTASLIVAIVGIVLLALTVRSIYTSPVVSPFARTISIPDFSIGYPWVSTYDFVNSSVQFTITINTPIDSEAISSISYSLDGEPKGNLSDIEVTTYHNYGPGKLNYTESKVDISFKDLAEGNHTVVASAIGMSDSRFFTVNSYYHITALNVVSPASSIFSSSNVPLKFTYTGEITNGHYYLYNGADLVSDKPLNGDATLDNLSSGSYRLLVFVTTQYGQDSKEIDFLVISIPTAVVALVITLLSLSIGLLITWEIKRKKAFS